MIRAEREIEKLKAQEKKERLVPIEYRKNCKEKDIDWNCVEYMHKKRYSIGKIANIFGCKPEVIKKMIVDHDRYNNFDCKYYQMINRQESCQIHMDMKHCGRYCVCSSYNEDFIKGEPIYTKGRVENG